MPSNIYIYEKLALAARPPSRQELALAQALAGLPRRPSAARRLARLSGRALIEMGGRLLAYSAGRRQLARLSDLPPYSPPSTYSQN